MRNTRELREVIDLIKKAGREILKIYQREFKSYQKEDKTPVTEADFAAQKIILSGLRKYNYGIISEESKNNSPFTEKEKVWLVDPIDGTKDFLEKTGEFSIMIGLIDKGEPILGVVYKPIGEKMYFAEKGKGAFLKEGGKPLKKLKVSNVSSLADCCLLVSRFHLNDSEDLFIKDNKLKDVKHAGSTGIKVGLIAEGKADAYLNISDKTCQWDTCASEIILKEAGGKISDLKGGDLSYNCRELRNLNGILATNKKIHSQIIKQTEDKKIR